MSCSLSDLKLSMNLKVCDKMDKNIVNKTKQNNKYRDRTQPSYKVESIATSDNNKARKLELFSYLRTLHIF